MLSIICHKVPRRPSSPLDYPERSTACVDLFQQDYSSLSHFCPSNSRDVRTKWQAELDSGEASYMVSIRFSARRVLAYAALFMACALLITSCKFPWQHSANN